MEKEALEQLTTGKSLYGEGGNFTPLLKRFIEKALEAVVGGMDTLQKPPLICFQDRP